MHICLVIFDGLTALDAIGGYEVLARLPGAELDFAAPNTGVIAADTRRLGIMAYKRLADVERTDILYVPGGPGAVALEGDPDFLGQLRRLDATSSHTVAICNGVGLLAAAGLLEGRRATTNWFFRAHLRERGVEVVDERVVRDGKYLTGAGVSASIDTGLTLAKELAGEEVARMLQLGIEYYPRPPLPDASPAEVPERLQAMVRSFEGGRSLLHRPPAWG